MNDSDVVFALRKRIFDDWKYRGLSWRDICFKYRVSKRWFYKLRQRYMLEGYDGLKDRTRNNDNRPYRVNWQQRLRILDYVYHNPTHGPASSFLISSISLGSLTSSILSFFKSFIIISSLIKQHFLYFFPLPQGH